MTLRCASCESPTTTEDYVAVGPSTPAAKELDLDNRRPGRGHLVVCQSCFNRACRRINDRTPEV